MLSGVSVGTSNQVSWGSGASYQRQTGWRHPTVALGVRMGVVSLGTFLILHCLPSLSMINRETLVPGAASRDRQSSPLACSNESHLLVGFAPSEPPLLPTISSLAVTLGLPFPNHLQRWPFPCSIYFLLSVSALIRSEQAWCFYFVLVSAHWESWGLLVIPVLPAHTPS